MYYTQKQMKAVQKIELLKKGLLPFPLARVFVPACEVKQGATEKGV